MGLLSDRRPPPSGFASSLLESSLLGIRLFSLLLLLDFLFTSSLSSRRDFLCYSSWWASSSLGQCTSSSRSRPCCVIFVRVQQRAQIFFLQCKLRLLLRGGTFIALRPLLPGGTFCGIIPLQCRSMALRVLLAILEM